MYVRLYDFFLFLLFINIWNEKHLKEEQDPWVCHNVLFKRKEVFLRRIYLAVDLSYKARSKYARKI